jgi:AbrB family looped-hinge helix DNA binding protein
MAIAKVSKKGWVVIPHDIRERYGIRPGDKVHVIDYGGRIALVPALKDPIHELRGMFKGGPSLTEALLEDRRWEREQEERKYQEWVSHAKEKALRDG